MVAGERSGVGKTMLTLALAQVLRERGLRVQCFKVGPDFIDPGYHRAVTGRPSVNLDGWMMGRSQCLSSFERHTHDADAVLVEGVMGLFDGCDGTDEAGSSAQIARWLGLPIVLIIDGSSLARTAAAIVLGFEQYDRALRVAGVIFNRVANNRHYELLRTAVKQRCQSEVLGYVPRGDDWHVPERHLGLIMPSEIDDFVQRVSGMAAVLRQSVELDAVMSYRRARHSLDLPCTDASRSCDSARPTKIGVAWDEAFCFYYPDNLELLERHGSQICHFSPIHDQALPQGLDGIYLGGGYPELHAAALHANQCMREQMLAFCRSGKPVYAECGGLLYLLKDIEDQHGRTYAMVGLLPASARMRPRYSRLGYSEVEALSGCTLLNPGQRVRGHEFHYSEITEMPGEITRSYRIYQSRASVPRTEGYRIYNVLASYVHLHFGSNPDCAANFVKCCRENQIA